MVALHVVLNTISRLPYVLHVATAESNLLSCMVYNHGHCSFVQLLQTTQPPALCASNPAAVNHCQATQSACTPAKTALTHKSNFLHCPSPTCMM